jgi:hypothetical protein
LHRAGCALAIRDTRQHRFMRIAPGGAMISKPWRDRLVYLAMSLFVGWHLIAMLLAPAPSGSPMVEALNPLFRPYLTLFRLESSWSFFANVIRLNQFRYVIEDADGNKHTFTPMSEFRWYHPRYNWFDGMYWAITDRPAVVGPYFVAPLCRQHAALKPVSITFLVVTGGGEEFRPEHLLDGYSPLELPYATIDPVLFDDCPK